MTKVVNVKTDRYDVYIGRPSMYGNPFKIGRDGDRKQVLKKYKEWFDSRMVWDQDFCKNIKLLKDLTLGCWCKPLTCHGDVIAEYLDSL